MSKAPIILIGGAAILGLAAVASKRPVESATTIPQGKTAKDMTDAQKKKLADWAKQKGIPVDKAWDLAKSVYSQTRF